MKTILEDLELPTIENIINIRILWFLEKVALTREVLRSHAKPAGALKRGAKPQTTRQSYVRALNAAGLLVDSPNDGAFSKWWMHRFGERDIGLTLTNNGKSKRTILGPASKRYESIAVEWDAQFRRTETDAIGWLGPIMDPYLIRPLHDLERFYVFTSLRFLRD
jgi:hypothetical protein